MNPYYESFRLEAWGPARQGLLQAQRRAKGQVNHRDYILYTRFSATERVSLQWVTQKEEKFHLCLCEKEGNLGWE